MIKEKPILFQPLLVRSILDDYKTQTRRIIKPQPIHIGLGQYSVKHHQDSKVMTYLRTVQHLEQSMRCRYGDPGTEIWVRETWAYHNNDFIYKADNNEIDGIKWKPSIHMPRKASRLTLMHKNNFIQSVTMTTESDAIAEGVEWGYIGINGFEPLPRNTYPGGWRNYQNPYKLCDTALMSFVTLWNKINAPWKPLMRKKKIIGFESYPWSSKAIPEIPNKFVKNGKTIVPFTAYPSPIVRTIDFGIHSLVVWRDGKPEKFHNHLNSYIRSE